MSKASIKGRYKGIGHIRKLIKEELKVELEEIDDITKRILGV
ncbi:MAG: hypothetical protein ACE5IC_05900 [Candidatus Brocadiales bacterium]